MLYLMRLVAVLCVILTWSHQAFAQPADFILPCGDRPNCVSSAADPSGAQNPKWAIAPFSYCQKRESTVHGTLIQVLKDQRLQDIHVNKMTNVIEAVAVTRIFRFKDDLRFYIDTRENKIHIRSESRIGYSDFGKNRKRLEQIRDAFRFAIQC